jgi:uncharacterized Zn finger protein (UPF0148 family)
MLALTCPICNTALMENKSNEKLCPFCNVPVVMEKDIDRSEINFEDEGVTIEKELPRKSYDELRAEFEKSNKRRNEVSNLVGQKLLMGWTMLEQSCAHIDCNGTPLMREKQSSPAICLCCNSQFHVSHGIVTSVSTGAASENKTIAAETASPDKKSKLWGDNEPILNLQKVAAAKDNDPSYKISQKLLQGWTLLDKACTALNCGGNIPLMREKSGKLFCVNCGYLETKPEASKNVTTEDMDDDLDELESSFLVESLVQRAMKADLAPASGNQQKLVTSATRCPVDDPIVMTEMILLKKMATVAKDLERESNLLQCGELTDLIVKLASGIKAVTDLKCSR